MKYTNVAVTFALVFAMTGGALAASKYVITSTKQISPKVLKSLTGKTGVAGAQGPAGSAGPTGAVGPQGAPGAQGPAGPEGKTGPQGVPGTNGKNGTTGFTETLPEGKTEKGSWVLNVPVENPTFKLSLARAAISFVIPLEAEPAAHYLKAGEGETPECPGTAENPKAAEGNLCVYAQTELNVPSIAVSGSTFGAVFGGSGGEPGGIAFGSWAVTAG